MTSEKNSVTEENIGIVKIIFDYPYELAIPEEKYVVDISESEAAVIEIKIREGVIIHDKGLVLRGNGDKGAEGVSLLEVKEEDFKPTILRAWVSREKPAIDLQAGKYGKTIFPWHYTEVSVIFGVNDLNKVTDYVSVFTYVRKIFNQFILLYKDAFHDYLVTELKEEEHLINYFELWTSELTLEEKKMATLPLLMQNREYKPLFKNMGNPIVSSKYLNLGSSNIKKKLYNGKKIDQYQFFLNNLTTHNPIFVFNEILLHGLEKLFLNGDYKFSILEFETAFEMTILYFLNYFLKREGKSDTEIKNLLKKNSNYYGVINQIQRLDDLITKYRLSKGLKPNPFFGSVKQLEWRDFVYEKRNKAIHEWRNYSKKEAEESFVIAQSAIRTIQAIVKESVSDAEVLQMMKNK